MNLTIRQFAALAFGTTTSVLAWVSACSVEDGVLGRLQNENGAATGGSSPTALVCELTSPVVTVVDSASTQAYDTCASRIASAHFVSALCTCGNAVVGEFLVTRGFDSNLGVYQQGQVDDGGAAVGINGNYSSIGYTDIGGSFTVAGSDSVRFIGQLLVRGDFRAAGSVNVTGSTTVSRDVWLGSSFIGLGPFTVAGTLHHTGPVSALPLVATSQSEEPVAIPRPCACDASERLDITGLVEQARTNNDNQRLSIDSKVLTNVSGNVAITLPCGRLFLEQATGVGNVTLHVTGKLALFVGNSIELLGNLNFQLAPGAEVDLFVAKNVAVSEQLTLSTSDRPAAGRLYVGGNGDIVLTSPWIGNLYAPLSNVHASAALEAWGSIFCKDFVTANSTNVIFDRAIVDANKSCEASQYNGTCSQCGWCSGGNACVAGTCGPCRQDSDCCGQAVCISGSCGPLVILQ